ncbi:MAG: 2-amino-4-hydroxy-6-hydroxymethyldihydropteridine diphosphokinase [Desulfococcaceae bacterium]
MGTNLGDKIGQLRAALSAMESWDQTEITGRSALYRTAPVGYADQDWFLNMAVRLRTRMEPSELLAALHTAEHSQGRDRSGPRFGPRTLDLDILLFDDRIVETEALTIPHPRMDKRRFVLRPLCDIDPTVCHPGLNATVRALLDRLDPSDQPMERLESETM